MMSDNAIKQHEQRRKVALIIMAVLICILAGFLLGNLTAEPDVKTLSAPAATVTVAPAAKTIEKVTVPQECLDALDEADRGFKLAADSSEEFSGAITAIQNSDVDGINEATDNINSINTSLGNLSPQYTADKLVCRAKAK